MPFWGAGGRFRFIQQSYSGLGTGWVLAGYWELAGSPRWLACTGKVVRAGNRVPDP